MNPAMRICALMMLAITAGACSGAENEPVAEPDAMPQPPDSAWLQRFDGTTTFTFDVPAGNPIPDQIIATTWVGTAVIADDYQVSLDRDDDLDRWFVPLDVDLTAGTVVAGYSFGSFIADDPDGNTTVIMMTTAGGAASIATGPLTLGVEGTISAQQGLEVAEGTFDASFRPL
jgi:hypothetical protein